MANFSQINPGKYHLGYRFPTPILIDKLNMDSQDKHRVELKFKHSVIVGRTVYVGNVQVFSRENGTIKVEGDSMYKSIVNEFDVFTDYNKIEAAVSDGENITALAEFADKILQFKQNTLYIINVSRQVEILESTHKHKGVSNPAAVCKTDYGIAWVNEHGCYLYDGKSVHDLLEKSGQRKIKESTWSSFVSSNGVMIGYYPRKRQIIVVRDSKGLFTLTGSIDVTGVNKNVPGTGTRFLTELHVGDSITVSGETRIIDSITNDTTATVSANWGSDLSDDTSPDCIPVGDAYIYDIVTTSWIHSSGSFASAIKSNFITDWNGDLVHATSATPKKWDNSPSDPSNISLVTKDIDFGQPAVRKKVYRVRMSYKGDASSLEVKYSINGDTNTLYNFELTNSDGTASGSANAAPLLDKSGDLSTWYHAELKPATASQANNIYSFQLHLDGSVGATFEINDISFIFRIKGVK